MRLFGRVAFVKEKKNKLGSLMGREHMGHLSTHEKIILKCILEK
jgi:hypothetical protein